MQILDMPAVDVAMLIVLAVSAGVGVWRGFIYEAASLLGWVVAYVGAQRFHPGSWRSGLCKATPQSLGVAVLSWCCSW